MPNKLEEARKLLVARLEEIDRERDQLIEAVARLNEVPARSSKRRPPVAASTSKRGRRGSSKRAPRGQREKQLISSIKANPEYRVSDHAREVGVKPQQLYPILDRLMKKSVVEKKDRRYQLSET